MCALDAERECADATGEEFCTKHALSMKGEHSALAFQVSWVAQSGPPLWFQNLPSGPGGPWGRGGGPEQGLLQSPHWGSPGAHPALSKLYINPTMFPFV